MAAAISSSADAVELAVVVLVPLVELLTFAVVLAREVNGEESFGCNRLEAATVVVVAIGTVEVGVIWRSLRKFVKFSCM